jgi:hypothetical protein
LAVGLTRPENSSGACKEADDDLRQEETESMRPMRQQTVSFGSFGAGDNKLHAIPITNGGS